MRIWWKGTPSGTSRTPVKWKQDQMFIVLPVWHTLYIPHWFPTDLWESIICTIIHLVSRKDYTIFYMTGTSLTYALLDCKVWWHLRAAAMSQGRIKEQRHDLWLPQLFLRILHWISINLASPLYFIATVQHTLFNINIAAKWTASVSCLVVWILQVCMWDLLAVPFGRLCNM